MSHSWFKKFRPSFERLENREVFSAGPLTSAMQFPHDNDVMFRAAPEPSAFVSQLEFEMLNARSANQSLTVPTGTVHFVQNETAAAHDAVSAQIGANAGRTTGIQWGQLPPERSGDANSMVILPEPGVNVDRDWLGAPQTKHDTVKNSIRNSSDSGLFGPATPRAGTLAGVTLPDRAEVVAPEYESHPNSLLTGSVTEYGVVASETGSPAMLRDLAEEIDENAARQSGPPAATRLTGSRYINFVVAPQSGPPAAQWTGWLEDVFFVVAPQSGPPAAERVKWDGPELDFAPTSGPPAVEYPNLVFALKSGPTAADFGKYEDGATVASGGSVAPNSGPAAPFGYATDADGDFVVAPESGPPGGSAAEAITGGYRALVCFVVAPEFGPNASNNAYFILPSGDF